MKKKVLLIPLALLLAMSLVVTGCAAPVEPPPAPPPVEPEKPAPPEVSPLDQVIEAARAEGEVVVRINPEVDELELKRLEDEIEERFGVKLHIIQEYAGAPAAVTSKLYMELMTGVTPHLDLHWGTAFYAFLPEFQAITKEIDWYSLLTEDIDPAAVQEGFPVPTLSFGDATYDLIYRTDKLSADEVPTTFTALADPKLRGRVGIANYSSQPVNHAFFTGDKEEVYAGVKASLDNDPFLGRYGDLMARIELGEIWVAQTVSHRFGASLARGVPVGYAWLYDMVVVDAYSSIVVKGAKHPNATTLVLLYLASPAGAKWSEDTWGMGTSHYAGNWMGDKISQAKKEAIPVLELGRWPEYVKFMLSDEMFKWREEAELILMGE